MSWTSNEENRATFLRLLSPAPNERILDVGAGKGEVAALVRRTGSSEVYAIDPDKKSVAQGQKQHPDLKVCMSGAESIPYEDGCFDKVYSTLAVHHYADREKSFREIARVLKTGGLFIVVDINPRSFVGRLNRFIENTIMRAHLRFMSLGELTELLRKEGEFEIREGGMSGAGYFVQAVKKMAGA